MWHEWDQTSVVKPVSTPTWSLISCAYITFHYGNIKGIWYLITCKKIRFWCVGTYLWKGNKLNYVDKSQIFISARSTNVFGLFSSGIFVGKSQNWRCKWHLVVIFLCFNAKLNKFLIICVLQKIYRALLCLFHSKLILLPPPLNFGKDAPLFYFPPILVSDRLQSCTLHLWSMQTSGDNGNVWILSHLLLSSQYNTKITI